MRDGANAAGWRSIGIAAVAAISLTGIAFVAGRPTTAADAPAAASPEDAAAKAAAEKAKPTEQISKAASLAAALKFSIESATTAMEAIPATRRMRSAKGVRYMRP